MPKAQPVPCVFQEAAAGWAVSTDGLAVRGPEAFTARGTTSWSEREDKEEAGGYLWACLLH